jgi:hypothetical protein
MTAADNIIERLHRLHADAAALLVAIGGQAERGVLPAPLHRAAVALADLRHILGAGVLPDLPAPEPIVVEPIEGQPAAKARRAR